MRLRCRSIYILASIFTLFLLFFSGFCRNGFCNNNSVDRLLSKALEAETAGETVCIQELDLQAFSYIPDVEAACEDCSASSFQRTDSKSPWPDNRHGAGSVGSLQDWGPDLDWERKYFGPLDDTIRFVQQTSDGGYIMVGETCSPSNGGSDIYLVKVNDTGSIVWQNNFGGEGNDFGCCVREVPGGYVLVGSTQISGVGSYDVCLIRTDASGNQLWEKTYGGMADDYGKSVWVNSDGTMLIAGETNSFGNGGSDIYLFKVGASGSHFWSKCIGGSNDDWAESVQTIGDGIIIAGGTKTFGAGMSDAFLVKTDTYGNKLWHKTFGGPADDLAFDLQQTQEGDFVVAGRTESFGEGGVDAFLVKTDSSGNRQWEKCFGGEADDWARSVRQTTDGGYLLGGSSCSFGLGDSDFYLVKIGAYGELLWEKTRGQGENAYGNCAIQTAGGGFLLAGETSSAAGVFSDGWLVKYKAEDVTGDLNGDYAVNVLDLLWMSQWLGPVKCSSSQKADLNYDGNVNILDMQLVYNLIGQGPVPKELLIYEILPGSGPVGTEVEILGRGFGPAQGTSTVTFNGLTASVTAWSDSRIKVLVPDGAVSGSVVVKVEGRSSNGIYFEVTTGNETVLESQTGVIGPDGGMVTLPDGACLFVSPGVLEAGTSLTLCKIENERNFSSPYWQAYEVRGVFERLPAYLAVPVESGLNLEQIGVYYYNPESGEGVRPPFEYFPLTGNVVVSLIEQSTTFELPQFSGKRLASAGLQVREELFPGYRVIIEVAGRSDAPCAEKIIKMPFYQRVAETSWAADAAMLGKAFSPYTDRSAEIEIYNFLKCVGEELVNNVDTWDFKHRLNHCFHSLTGVEARTCNWISAGNLKEFMRAELDKGNPLILRYPGYSLLVLGYRDYRQGERRVLDFYVHDSRGVDPPSSLDGTMYTWRNYEDWLLPRLNAEPGAINSLLWVYDTPPHPERALQTLSPPSLVQPGEFRFEYKNEHGAVVRAWLGFSENEPEGYAWFVGPFQNGTRLDLIPAQAALRLALNVWNADLDSSAATDLEVKIFKEGSASPVYSHSGNLTVSANRSPSMFVHNVPSCVYKSDGNIAKYTLQVELYNSGVYQDGFAVDFILDDGPVICAISPDSGERGSQITINGFGFGTVQDISTVTFNGVPAEEIISWSATSIVVKVPDKAAGGDLRVTVNGKVSNGVPFGVKEPA